MITYTLAGGCFWCLDAVFRQLKGVETSVCGYTGGDQDDANYYAVASGMTAHAEAVQVTFDESILPAGVLLDIFFLIHDPTSVNKQGADEGPQYRSAMFYADQSQKQQFEAAVKHSQSNWEKPVVTEIAQLQDFYAAEPEHQNYFSKYPASGYCSVVISPKVIKAKGAYSEYMAHV